MLLFIFTVSGLMEYPSVAESFPSETMPFIFYSGSEYLTRRNPRLPMNFSNSKRAEFSLRSLRKKSHKNAFQTHNQYI